MTLTDHPTPQTDTEPATGREPDRSMPRPRRKQPSTDGPPFHSEDLSSAAGAASATHPSRWRDGERWIRIATVLAVLSVAGIAAIVSYRHMRAVALANGEDHVSSSIIPLAVDGLIIAASMTMLADSRDGRKRSALAYGLLALASAASLAANVMHAQPTLPARIIAAWPSAALIGAYELLMAQIRGAVGAVGAVDASAAPAGQDAPPRAEAVPPEPRPQIAGAPDPTAAGASQTDIGAEASPHTPKDSSDSAPESLTPSIDVASARAEASTAAPVIPIRPGSKKYQLRQLLARLPADDTRSVYALAKDLAPRIDLHEGTARRYISQLRGDPGARPA